MEMAREHFSHDVDVRWMYIGGLCPTTKIVCNTPESKFLTGEVE